MYPISIIHPSRSRPEMASRTVDHWLGNAEKPGEIEYILSLDQSDPYLISYLKQKKTGVIILDNKSAIEAINNAAVKTTGNILMVVSDDFECFPSWDVKLLETLSGKTDYVVKTLDGQQPWIMTLPIMDRTYYNRFGYIYYPGYSHMFADTEMSHVGDLLDRTVRINLCFPHAHYTTGKMQMDAINEKNNATWNQGEALYLDRLKQNFGLTSLPGKLRCDPSHWAWLRSKGVDISKLK